LAPAVERIRPVLAQLAVVLPELVLSELAPPQLPSLALQLVVPEVAALPVLAAVLAAEVEEQVAPLKLQFRIHR